MPKEAPKGNSIPKRPKRWDKKKICSQCGIDAKTHPKKHMQRYHKGQPLTFREWKPGDDLPLIPFCDNIGEVLHAKAEPLNSKERSGKFDDGNRVRALAALHAHSEASCTIESSYEEWKSTRKNPSYDHDYDALRERSGQPSQVCKTETENHQGGQGNEEEGEGR